MRSAGAVPSAEGADARGDVPLEQFHETFLVVAGPMED
ncbi:hypothetical protein A20C1_03458 [marine actinobacterium PHSC20C1]|nr:hypothetical protein A20C1_03458 [marine actinobacterium PHSC20C1]